MKRIRRYVHVDPKLSLERYQELQATYRKAHPEIEWVFDYGIICTFDVEIEVEDAPDNVTPIRKDERNGYL